MKKEVAGQPLWLWAVGAVVIVGGYLYFRSHQAASTSGQGGTGQGGGKYTSTSSIKEWITQHDGAPTPPPKPPPKPPPHKHHHHKGD